jgi:hypothetical protein
MSWTTVSLWVRSIRNTTAACWMSLIAFQLVGRHNAIVCWATIVQMSLPSATECDVMARPNNGKGYLKLTKNKFVGATHNAETSESETDAQTFYRHSKWIRVFLTSSARATSGPCPPVPTSLPPTCGQQSVTPLNIGDLSAQERNSLPKNWKDSSGMFQPQFWAKMR